MRPKQSPHSVEALQSPHTAVPLSPEAPVCHLVLDEGQCCQHRLSPSVHTPSGCLLPSTCSCSSPAAYVQPPTAGSCKRWFDLHVIHRKDWSLQIFSTARYQAHNKLYWLVCSLCGCHFHPPVRRWCDFCRRKTLLSLYHLTVMNLCPPLAILWKEKPPQHCFCPSRERAELALCHAW